MEEEENLPCIVSTTQCFDPEDVRKSRCQSPSGRNTRCQSPSSRNARLVDDLLGQLIFSFSDEQKENEDEPLSIAEKLRRRIFNMVKIRKGLTVDSRAADHVMPVWWLIMFVVLESIGAIRGVHYVAADGTRIPNVGQRFMTIDGPWTEIMFQLAVISKPLVSVSKLNESGCRVIFDKDRSYILPKKTKKVINMRKERRVFLIVAYVAKKPSQGFKGQR